MVRNPIVFIGLASLAAPALAQSAIVTATHDHPTGLVQPGETVRLSIHATWTSAYKLGRVVGDVLATPDVGVASNNSGGVGQGPLIHYGTPVLGSVRGVDVGSGPELFGPHIPFINQPVIFLQYDWTAPQTLGVVDFRWAPHPEFPDVQFYLTQSAINIVPLPTTYIGTSLTVVPAPGGAAVAMAAGVLAWTRRRRKE